MTYIEIVGRVNEDGSLDAKVPAGTPVGKVNIIIVLEPDDVEADEALWEESFQNTQAELSEMAKKVSAARKAGLAKPFDPDVDLDESGEPIA